MGEEESDAAIGVAALAIGVYSALMADLMLTGWTYIVVWLFAKRLMDCKQRFRRPSQ